MYKFKVFWFVLALQHVFIGALPRFKPLAMAKNSLKVDADELNSALETRNIATNLMVGPSSPPFLRKHHWPSRVHNTHTETLVSSKDNSDVTHVTISNSHLPQNHRFNVGNLSDNTDEYSSSNLLLNTRNIGNANNQVDSLDLEVRQNGAGQPPQQHQPQPAPPNTGFPQAMQMQQPQSQPMPTQQQPQGQIPQSQLPTIPQPQIAPFPQPTTGGVTQPYQMDGQFHGQPQVPLGYPASTGGATQPYQMDGQFHGQPQVPFGYPASTGGATQPYQMDGQFHGQPQAPFAHPGSTGGATQPYQMDGQFHSQPQVPFGQPQAPFGQPQAPFSQPQAPFVQPGSTGGAIQPHQGQPQVPYGQTGSYTMQSPQWTGQVSYPSAPATGWPMSGVPVPPTYPYNTYPPTGQMQLPIPQSQFSGFGSVPQYTNPVYGTPLSPAQNNIEAQIASAFLSTQIANMLNDPHTRESLLYFITELRSMLSNPNSVPLMKAMTNRANEIMNTPSTYSQYMPQGLPQTVPHATSTTVQIQGAANTLLDKLKDKGGKIMTFVKDIADANTRLLQTTTSDIPLVGNFVKTGTDLASAGVGMIDGMVAPFLHPSNGGTTTVTTVSTPQTMTSFPSAQFQTPAVTVNG